ncbi:ATP-binding protein [Legionella bononiensis]|uniref:ATP-binding protein n=1 Tax=Legionella bononiensis TaxID=2793102 RepID=A0ABS1WBR0_9GAMM|nr:ATP-binding protein [Legionella bononiensis]MBL7481081.1 ATP-binding protein [Legionella bononiensis]MBL7526790.1 ATP-binding protein [Legionella bononiensis]MBL7564197.1 ATP-binding protein [Legionella bononiensis]
MSVYEQHIVVCDLVHANNHSRDYKLIIANSMMKSIIDFLNHCFIRLKLNIAYLPYDYDPNHESRWTYFFLRETIRNSIDSCYSKPDAHIDHIEIKVTLKTVDEHLFLKIKDNGIGFSGIAPGVRLTKSPENTKKDKTKMLGGKGFGLEICQEKLPLLFCKNRKHGGASVQCSLGKKPFTLSL